MMGIQGCCRANLQYEPASMVVRQGNRAYPVSPIYMREPAAEDGTKGAGQNASADSKPLQKAVNEEGAPSGEG